MPLDNSLNVSEMLRRLGVKGDSLGSAPLLESLRANIRIADLTQLLPPLMGPIGAGSIRLAGGAGNRNRWSIVARSPGGIRILNIRYSGGVAVRVFITDNNVFGIAGISSFQSLSFEQPVATLFTAHLPDPATLAPPQSLEVNQATTGYGWEFPNWVGPGQSFNIEGEGVNTSEEIHLMWMEYPAALNP